MAITSTTIRRNNAKDVKGLTAVNGDNKKRTVIESQLAVRGNNNNVRDITRIAATKEATTQGYLLFDICLFPCLLVRD